MIEADHLAKRFGSVTAVEDVSLRVDEGEVLGLLGPNGAGKTTTVRMLVGLLPASGGTIRVDGLDPSRPDQALDLRRRVGLLPENVGLYEDLSAARNLDFFGRLYDCPEPTRSANIERLLRLLGLWERRDEPVGRFSKGMQQKVALARALVHDPPVVFLDEPTANLDPEASRTVRDFLLGLKADRRTIVLTTHNLDEATRICDRVAVLKTRLLAVGRPGELGRTDGIAQVRIRLAAPRPDVRAALLARLGPDRVGGSGAELLLRVGDPASETPDLVAAVVAAGGRILAVSEIAPSLEEEYLRLVGAAPGAS